MLKFILLWSTALTLAVVTTQKDCITGTISQQYNEESEICCPFGIVHRFTIQEEEQACCVNQTYLLKTQMCCGNSVLNKVAANGDKTRCCGGIQHKTNDQSKLCCNDKLYDVMPGETSQCCGDSKMDISKQVCCKTFKGQRKVHNKQPNSKCCQDNYYNKMSHHCYRNRQVLPINHQLCGKTQYNVLENKCCGTTLHKNLSEEDSIYSCCGENVFRTAERKCCKNNLIPAQRSCCHEGSYNEKTERCCEKGPVKFTKKTEQCCGAGLIDTEHEGCCGTYAYNTTTHQCCLPGGPVIPKAPDLKCCGPTSYNSSTKVCCKYLKNVKVIPKGQDHDDKCCSKENSNIAQSYSSSTHICSLGMIISNDEKMCGGRYKMNEFKDLCCQGLFYQDGKMEGKKCCGVRAKKRCNGRKKNGRNRVKRKNKRKKKSLDNYGICRICKNSMKNFRKSLRSKDVDICRHQALKVTVMDQQSDTPNFQKIYLQTKKDFYSDTNIDGEEIEVLLPCPCQISSRYAILMTDTRDFSRPLRLGDSDVLLPWTSKIRQHIKRQRKRCPTLTNNLALSSMSEIQDFVTYKIQTMKKNNGQQDIK